MTPVNIALPFIFFGFTATLAIVVSKTGPQVSYLTFLNQVTLGFLLPFGIAALAGGMLAVDVKEYWTRTMLLRPVTREQYLVARILAVFTGYLACVLVAGLFPPPVAALIADKPLVGSFWQITGFVILSSMQGLLLIVLATMFSCWLPGIFNLVILALWAMSSQMVGGYLGRRYWDDGLMTSLKEFTFPSGFMDAAADLGAGVLIPWSGIAWGCAALAAFSGVTIWAFNRLNVEASWE
jgi:ABC-type transport system involved in multi-copper enzyme maturation permease subunit